MSTIPHSEGSPPPGGYPPGTPYYYPPPPPPRRGFWRRLLVLIFVGSLILNLVLIGKQVGGLLQEGKVDEKFISHDPVGADKVAIVPIEGVIMEGDDGFVCKAIETALKDKHVKAIVLRVNSPGGSVSSSDLIYHRLCQLKETKKIPIVVSMGGIAASGGYYVSMAVGHDKDVIFAEPTGFTGSIGVIIPHYNLKGLLDKYNVSDDSIVSGSMKEMGSLTKEMTPKQREVFQALVDESYKHFLTIVQSGRAKYANDLDGLKKLADGRIYSAAEAADPVKNGLIDKTGFLDDAVDRAIELAKLDKEKVRVVRYESEPSLKTMLLGGESKSSMSADLKAVLETATPRAYYLTSWLPGAAGASK